MSFQVNFYNRTEFLFNDRLKFLNRPNNVFSLQNHIKAVLILLISSNGLTLVISEEFLLVLITTLTLVVSSLKGYGTVHVSRLLFFLVIYMFWRYSEATLYAMHGITSLRYLKKIVIIFIVILLFSEGIKDIKAFSKVLLFYLNLVVLFGVAGYFMGNTQLKYIAGTGFYKEYSVLMSVRIESVLLMIWHALRFAKTRRFFDFGLFFFFLILPHIAAGEIERWIAFTQLLMISSILMGKTKRALVCFLFFITLVIWYVSMDNFLDLVSADASLLARIHELELAKDIIFEDIWFGAGLNIIDLNQGRFFVADIGYVGMLLMHGIGGTFLLLLMQWKLYKDVIVHSFKSIEETWWVKSYIFFVLLSISKLTLILNVELFIALSLILKGIVINGNKYNSLRL